MTYPTEKQKHARQLNNFHRALACTHRSMIVAKVPDHLFRKFRDFSDEAMAWIAQQHEERKQNDEDIS